MVLRIADPDFAYCRQCNGVRSAKAHELLHSPSVRRLRLDLDGNDVEEQEQYRSRGQEFPHRASALRGIVISALEESSSMIDPAQPRGDNSIGSSSDERILTYEDPLCFGPPSNPALHLQCRARSMTTQSRVDVLQSWR